MSMTLEQAIKHAEEVADKKLNNAEFIKNNPYGDKSKIQGCVECAAEHRQLAAWLRELQERRKEPKIICCGECGHSMYDEDGELYCDNPNTDIYYTRYDFACNRSKRRTDGEKQSD